jgi:glycosyltransferase involved in cell wall biosynthesis
LCGSGLPYNSEYILNKFPVTKGKKRQIVFCSRFDFEKNPLLFIELAKRMKGEYEFVMTTSFDSIKSNSELVKTKMKEAMDEGIITVKVGLTKQQYYETLQESEYQVNCALQDWLSWTMLEAITYKCIPVYPKYRSFPEYLPSKYLYETDNVNSIIEVIRNNNYFDDSLQNIVKKFDDSFSRMVSVIINNGGRL